MFNLLRIIGEFHSAKNLRENVNQTHCRKWTIRFQVKTPKLFLRNKFICSVMSYNLNFQKTPPFEQINSEEIVEIKCIHMSKIERKFCFKTYICFFCFFYGIFLTVPYMVSKFWNFSLKDMKNIKAKDQTKSNTWLSKYGPKKSKLLRD